MWAFCGSGEQGLLLLQSTGSRQAGIGSCSMSAQELWHTASAALQHVGSSQTRNRTYVPCTGRQTPNHWTTRKVLSYLISFFFFLKSFSCSFFFFLLLLKISNENFNGKKIILHNYSSPCVFQLFMVFLPHYFGYHYSDILPETRILIICFLY